MRIIGAMVASLVVTVFGAAYLPHADGLVKIAAIAGAWLIGAALGAMIEDD
jgi:hypothetical protein